MSENDNMSETEKTPVVFLPAPEVDGIIGMFYVSWTPREPGCRCSIPADVGRFIAPVGANHFLVEYVEDYDPATHEPIYTIWRATEDPGTYLFISYDKAAEHIRDTTFTCDKHRTPTSAPGASPSPTATSAVTGWPTNGQ